MRAHGRKYEMGKRFALLIGLAVAGVMALSAQTALAGGDPVDSSPPDLQIWGPKKQNPQRGCPQPESNAMCNNNDPCSHGACSLEVRVSCDEVCTVRATGKLTNVKMDKLDPYGPLDMCLDGEPDEELALCPEFGPVLRPGPDGMLLGPWLGKKEQRKQVRRALDEGKNVKAKVTVRATDAAGNVATAKRTITLVK